MVNDRHSLLLCCLQLLHSLVVAVVHLLLQELAMVLHRLHLLRPTLFLPGQLLLKHKDAKMSYLSHMKSGIILYLLESTVPAFHSPNVHPASGSALSAA